MNDGGTAAGSGNGGIEWVVFDLGGVVVTPTARRPELAELLGADPPAFDAAYAGSRLDYDRTGDATGYWRTVAAAAGAPLPPDDLVDRLVEVDNQGWSVTDPPVLALVDDVRAAGPGLAVLSNAPSSMGRRVESAGWSTPFHRMLFSGDIGLVKPDPAIYALMVGQLRSADDAVVLIDDREENIIGAQAAGWHGIKHESAGSTRAALAELGLQV